MRALIKPKADFAIRRRLAALLIAAAAAVLPPTASAEAAELVMLERDGCAWCAAWREEIGPIYPKTKEARIAPLRVVNVDDPWPADLDGIKSDVFTPTFILVSNGEEIGRIRGYGGDEFFWYLLDEIIEKLPAEIRDAGGGDQDAAPTVTQ